MRCCGSWKPFVTFVVAAGALSAVIGMAYTEPAAVVPPAAAKPEAVHAEAVEAERSARERLRRRVTVRYEQRPLREAVEDLAKRAGVNLWIEEAAFEGEGIALDDPIDIDLPDVMVETALEIILPDVGATWFVHDEILRVTTPAKAEDFLVTRTYDVRRLVEAMKPWFELEEIDWRTTVPIQIGLVGGFGHTGVYRFSSTWPRGIGDDPSRYVVDVVMHETSGPWLDWDGIGGRITPYGSLLFVRANPRVQEEVATVIDGLTRLATAEKPMKPLRLWLPDGLAEENDKVRAALERPVAVDWKAKPLDEALAAFFKDSGIGHRIDRGALQEDDIPLDTPITLQRRGVSRRETLEAAFEPHGLTWIVEHGFLIVTTDVVQCAKLSTIVYDVRDLLIDGDFTPLFDLIENETYGPWISNDGVGGSVVSFGPRLLIVRQTQGVHEEIAELLELLREKRAVTAADQSDPDEMVTRFHRPPSPADPAETVAAIREFVAPGSWEGADGGRIRAVGDVLAVRQTRRVHRRIERFLARLAAEFQFQRDRELTRELLQQGVPVPVR
ncbi:MAG: hypothetical protein WD066_19925 [Planctomycetaceae bacterium]